MGESSKRPSTPPPSDYLTTRERKPVEHKEIYPWGKFIIDPATGLPEVEEGMFFRVKRSFLAGGYWKVSLRKRVGLWSREVSSRTWAPEDAINTYHILGGAAHALTDYWEKEEARKEKNDTSLLGDYPPKRLT